MVPKSDFFRIDEFGFIVLILITGFYLSTGIVNPKQTHIIAPKNNT